MLRLRAVVADPAGVAVLGVWRGARREGVLDVERVDLCAWHRDAVLVRHADGDRGLGELVAAAAVWVERDGDAARERTLVLAPGCGCGDGVAVSGAVRAAAVLGMDSVAASRDA